MSDLVNWCCSTCGQVIGEVDKITANMAFTCCKCRGEAQVRTEAEGEKSADELSERLATAEARVAALTQAVEDGLRLHLDSQGFWAWDHEFAGNLCAVGRPVPPIYKTREAAIDALVEALEEDEGR